MQIRAFRILEQPKRRFPDESGGPTSNLKGGRAEITRLHPDSRGIAAKFAEMSGKIFTVNSWGNKQLAADLGVIENAMGLTNKFRT
jgi:hypothetical protein